MHIKMNAEFYFLIFTFLTLVIGAAVQIMPSYKSWVASASLFFIAGLLFLVTTTIWLWHNLLWGIVVIIILFILIYCLLNNKIPKIKHPTWISISFITICIIGIIMIIIVDLFGVGFSPQTNIPTQTSILTTTTTTTETTIMTTTQTTGVPTTTTVTFNLPQGMQLSSVSPEDIMNDIENALPSLHQNVINQYIGVQYIWEVTLFSIDPITERIHAVSLTGNAGIFFNIIINDYQKINTLHRGDHFVVQGTILSIVEGLWINLSNCTLYFSN